MGKLGNLPHSVPPQQELVYLKSFWWVCQLYLNMKFSPWRNFKETDTCYLYFILKCYSAFFFLLRWWLYSDCTNTKYLVHSISLGQQYPKHDNDVIIENLRTPVVEERNCLLALPDDGTWKFLKPPWDSGAGKTSQLLRIFSIKKITSN